MRMYVKTFDRKKMLNLVNLVPQMILNFTNKIILTSIFTSLELNKIVLPSIELSKINFLKKPKN